MSRASTKANHLQYNHLQYICLAKIDVGRHQPVPCKKITKFQLNISKILICLLGKKKHWEIGCKCHYFNTWPMAIRTTYVYLYIERLMNTKINQV